MAFIHVYKIGKTPRMAKGTLMQVVIPLTDAMVQ